VSHDQAIEEDRSEATRTAGFIHIVLNRNICHSNPQLRNEIWEIRELKATDIR